MPHAKGKLVLVLVLILLFGALLRFEHITQPFVDRLLCIFPRFVRIKPGDAINFVAADKGHEVHSVPGMIPEEAQPFDAKISHDIKVTFTVPGVYVIACKPHTAMGMVGVIVVGDPTNIDKIDPSTLPGKASAKLDTLLEPLKKS